MWIAHSKAASTPANANVARFLHDLHGSASQLYSMVMLNATVISYDMVLRLCGVIFVVSTPLVLLLNWKKTAPGDPAAVPAGE